ncbi:MAG: hypothetical protein Q7V48_07150 [Deltaproteobacteria bacterium]|nr:hypothetical protein [Deltaproteobacteria bacterium]
MKIQKVEAYVLQGLLGDKAFGWSQGVANRRQTALGLVSTDSGIQGVGEAFYYGGPAKIVASAWNIPLIPHVWGTNVGLAASLQFFAALPHFPERRYPAEPFFEFDRSPHPPVRLRILHLDKVRMTSWVKGSVGPTNNASASAAFFMISPSVNKGTSTRWAPNRVKTSPARVDGNAGRATTLNAI